MGGTPRQRKLKQKHGGVLLTGLSSLLPSSTLEGVTLPTGMGPSHIPQASLEGGGFSENPPLPKCLWVMSGTGFTKLASRVLYHLTHTPRPFCILYFEIGSH